jgi:glycosyltransferase involved in cell wall biosynthesis
MDKNLKNSQKVICLDENTQDELIERFNLSEEKIEILPGFFIPNTQLVSQDVQIDIRSKFHIENDFFLYSGGDGIEKNLDRFVHVFERLHKKNISYDLVFLGDKIGKNIDLRHAIVES